MVASPAVLWSAKVVEPGKKLPVLLIVAWPALLLSRKTVWPPSMLVIVIDDADVKLWKIVCTVPHDPSLLIEVMPVVSALTMSNRLALVTCPIKLPDLASVPSCKVAPNQIQVPPE